jgi:hypothetical protein
MPITAGVLPTVARTRFLKTVAMIHCATNGSSPRFICIHRRATLGWRSNSLNLDAPPSHRSRTPPHLTQVVSRAAVQAICAPALHRRPRHISPGRRWAPRHGAAAINGLGRGVWQFKARLQRIASALINDVRGLQTERMHRDEAKEIDVSIPRLTRERQQLDRERFARSVRCRDRKPDRLGRVARFRAAGVSSCGAPRRLPTDESPRFRSPGS